MLQLEIIQVEYLTVMLTGLVESFGEHGLTRIVLASRPPAGTTWNIGLGPSYQPVNGITFSVAFHITFLLDVRKKSVVR